MFRAMKIRPSNSIINKKTSPQGGDNDPYNESTDEETEGMQLKVSSISYLN